MECLPSYLCNVGEPSSSSASGKLSSGSINEFFLRAMRETDSGFVEEAFKAAASLHTADEPPVASSKASSKASFKGERRVAKKQKKGCIKQPSAKDSANSGGKAPVVKAIKEQHDAMVDETETVHYKKQKYIYKMEKYNKSNSIGIRRKFGDGKQIFSLSSKKLTFEDLEKLALQVIGKLKAQLMEPQVDFVKVELHVKEWAHMQLNA